LHCHPCLLPQFPGAAVQLPPQQSASLLNVARNLPAMVILSGAKNLRPIFREILRCAQDDCAQDDCAQDDLGTSTPVPQMRSPLRSISARFASASG